MYVQSGGVPAGVIAAARSSNNANPWKTCGGGRGRRKGTSQRGWERSDWMHRNGNGISLRP